MAALRRYVPRSPTELLSHILEQQALVAAIRELPGPMLSTLIDRIGVEDSGDLIALASTEQLATLLDHDLWRADESGFEERFDPQRFALWLQVMGEAGEEFLVRRLSELPVDLLTLAINRLVLVIDMDALRSFYAGARDEAGQVESALENAVSEEWEEFCLIARDLDAWEDVWNALLLLDRDHHTRLRAILEQCCAMSLEYIHGQGGLYEVLTSDEMLESDALAARDDRRASQGYVSRSDARAFLELAREEQPPKERDAITMGYFRALETSQHREPAASSAERQALARAGAGAQELMRLVSEIDMERESGNSGARLLQQAATAGRLFARGNSSGLLDGKRAARDPNTSGARTRGEKAPDGRTVDRGRERATATESPHPAAGARTKARRHASGKLVTGARTEDTDGRPLLGALAALSNAEPTLHTTRTQELAYLANVILSGCTHEGRKLRPIEALEAAVALSNLGLELWPRAESERTSEGDVRLVRAVACDRMFRLAWATLQRDVVQVAAETLRSRFVLLDARRAQKARKCMIDRNLQGLRRVCAARELRLDEQAFELVLALADPLPWLAAGSLQERVRETSPWIATRSELEQVRERLEGLLLPKR
jgi:hypothetical protein